jgi:hypothetical protein
MKKINLLLFLTFSASVISCNQDDETKFVKQDFLKGLWKVSETGATDNQGIIKYVGVTECDSTSFAFGENKSYDEIFFNTVDGICTATMVKGTFDLEDNKVIISYKNAAGKELQHAKRVLAVDYEKMEFVYTDSITQQLVYKRLLKK